MRPSLLCSKLIEISYIDLAEQTLNTLENISEELPSSIVRENGLAALLNCLDFSSAALRTALQAASNCRRNVPPEYFQMIRGVWPIIRNCFGCSDQCQIEFCLPLGHSPHRLVLSIITRILRFSSMLSSSRPLTRFYHPRASTLR